MTFPVKFKHTDLVWETVVTQSKDYTLSSRLCDITTETFVIDYDDRLHFEQEQVLWGDSITSDMYQLPLPF